MEYVLIMIGIVFLIVGGVFIGITADDYNCWLAFIGILLVIGGGIMVAGSAASLDDKPKEIEKKYEKTYYYDGFKIDVEDVDLREFVITYDPEKDIYILTKKEN